MAFRFASCILNCYRLNCYGLNCYETRLLAFIKAIHVLKINNIDFNCDKLDIIINSIAMAEAPKSRLAEKPFLIEKQMAPGLPVTLTKDLAN